MAQQRFSSSTLIAVFLVAFLLFSVPSFGEMNIRKKLINIRGNVPTGNCIGKCSDFADCNQECINHGNTKGQCQDNVCCCIQ